MFEPLYLLLFAWFYFRGWPNHPWAPRLKAVFLWILLILVLNSLITRYFYGYSLMVLLSPQIMTLYVLRVVALLLAAYLGLAKRKKITMPEGIVR